MTRPLSLLTVPLILVAACQAAAAPSPSPTAGSLDGRTFLSISVTENSAIRQLVPGTRIRINFDGRNLGASVGCNSMSGEYELVGNRLILTGAGMTEMGCDDARHAQDDWLFGLLGAQPTLALDGDTLTITVGSTVIELVDREVAEPDAELVGPIWRVTTIIAGDTASSVPDGLNATIQFSDDGALTVETGCNSGGGRYAIEGDQMRISDLATTRRGCEGAAGDLESAFLAVVGAQVIGYQLDAQSLALQAGERGLQLTALAPG